MTCAPPHPPIGRAGRADLLWALANRHSDDGAMFGSLLGFDVRERAKQPSLADKAAELGDKASSAKAPVPPRSNDLPRAPLKCPRMWQARQPPEAETKQEEAAVWPASVELTDAALDRQLSYQCRFAPRAAPLWPEAHHVLRLQDSLARPLLSRQPDWTAVTTRLARQECLAPLPRRLGLSHAPHCVVLLDTREHLRVFEDDWRDLLQRLLQQRGSLGLEVWRLPNGPEGPWFALGGEVQRRAWSAHTAVLVVSDLGDRDPVWQACWHQSLLRWRAFGVHLSLLFPGARADMPGSSHLFNDRLPWTERASDRAADRHLLRLSQALSLAATVEPALVRACRRAFVPNAGSLLESRLWCQTNLQGTAFIRRWQATTRDELATALGDERQWVVPDLERLASIMRACHSHLPQVQQDQECLNLAAVFSTRGHPFGGEDWRRRVMLAQERQAQLVGHLSRQVAASSKSLVTDPGSSELLAGFALARINALAPQARSSKDALASQWFTLAYLPAARRGGPVPAVRGVDGRVLVDLLQLDGASTTGDAEPDRDSGPIWRVVQQGTALGLPERTAGIELHPKLGPARVSRGVIVTQAGVSRFLPTRLPWQALANLDASDQPIHIQLGAHSLVVESVKRPTWAAGWSHRQGRLEVLVRSPWGSMLTLPWPIDGPYIVGNLKGPTGFDYGADEWGLYFDLCFHAVALQRFRYIEPGRFLMGSPVGQGLEDEHPQHPVTITQGFWLADTPCTQAFWVAVMDGNNPSYFKEEGHGESAAQRPVEQVSWEDVVGVHGKAGFLDRLAALLPQGCTPTLPTEAEWEYAARAGSVTAYPWGDDMDSQRANTREGGLRGTTPVKQLSAPNAWGLHDLHGNVWEWCADGWRRDYRDQAELDPAGPKDSAFRLVRGGSWFDSADWARSAFRLGGPPDDRSASLGFRLALRSPGTGGPSLRGRPDASPAAGGGIAPAAGPSGPLAQVGRSRSQTPPHRHAER